jgi:hypothetical protein
MLHQKQFMDERRIVISKNMLKLTYSISLTKQKKAHLLSTNRVSLRVIERKETTEIHWIVQLV